MLDRVVARTATPCRRLYADTDLLKEQVAYDTQKGEDISPSPEERTVCRFPAAITLSDTGVS